MDILREVLVSSVEIELILIKLVSKHFLYTQAIEMNKAPIRSQSWNCWHTP